MGALQPIHWVIILIVVLMIFGAGRLPKAMGDMGRSLRSFRDQVRGDEGEPAPPPPERTKEV